MHMHKLQCIVLQPVKYALFGFLTDISCDIQAESSAGGAGVPRVRVNSEGAVLPDGV